MYTEEQQAYIALIKGCGYRVFHPETPSTYVYYTDGKNIGYAQWSRLSVGVSTVHKANHNCGTGFHMADEINADTLKLGFAFAPEWAYSRDRAYVSKFKDWDSFAASHWTKLVEA